MDNIELDFNVTNLYLHTKLKSSHAKISLFSDKDKSMEMRVQ